MMTALLLASFVQSAGAADTTLVVSGDPELARARLAAGIGVPVDQIKAVSLASVLPKATVVLVGTGRLESCASPVATNAEIRVAVEASERHVAYVELDQALTRLNEAAGKLGCLSEPVDAALAGRVHFLLGVVAHARGDGATADAAFRQAFAYQPGLKWDDDFPPDAVPLFEAAAVAKAAPAHLLVVPAPSVVFVDGNLANGGRMDLAPGVHIVQFGEPLSTWRVFADPGGTVGLVRPQAVPADAAGAWVKDPAKRNDLGVVLAAAFGSGFPLYVDDTASTWFTTTGPADWSAVAGVALAPVVVETPAGVNNGSTVDAAALVESVADVVTETRDTAIQEGGRRKKSAIGSSLLVGGALVLAGGGTLAGIQYGAARGIAADADAAAAADDFEAWRSAAEAYDQHRTLYAAGLAVGAVGAGAALGGVVAFTVAVGPMPRVALSFRW